MPFRYSAGEVSVVLRGLLPPELSKRYVECQLLGEGAHGRVLRARDLQLDRIVAIKFLHHNFADVPELKARFEREAKLSARLENKHVATIFDFGFADGAFYLVFEFVAGLSLETRLAKEGALDPQAARVLFKGILRGLAVAHSNGVTHRDLKPANILLTPSGEAVITDFGLARQEDDQEELTKTGAVMGTPTYMAPEQLAGGAPSPAWDLYAAGLVYYKMLQGKLPFPENDVHAMLREKTRSFDIEVEALASSKVTSTERQILAKLLTKESEARPSAKAALETLERPSELTIEEVLAESKDSPLGSHLSASLPAVKPISSSVPRSDSNARFLGFLGISLCMLLGGVGFFLAPFLTGDSPHTQPPSSETFASVDPEFAQEVESFRELIEEDPAIRAALGLQGQIATPQQVKIFKRGRAAFVELISESGIPEQLETIAPQTVDRASYTHLTRISLVERLLEHTRLDSMHGKLPSLYQGRERPQFQRVLNGGVTWVTLPEYESQLPWKDWEATRPYLNTLYREGRDWQPLRRFEDMKVMRDGKPVLHVDSTQPVAEWNVSVQNYFGVLFEHGFTDVNSLVQLYGRVPWRIDDYEDPIEVLVELSNPPSKDLILAIGGSELAKERHLLFQFDGSQDRLEVVLSVPPPKQVQRAEISVRVGGYLRIQSRLLPSGLKRMKIKPIGIQPVTQVTGTVIIEEIYQFRSGPLPEPWKDS